MNMIVDEIINISRNLASSNILPIIKDLIYQQASVHAPDLVYAKGELFRIKRPQESMFIHSSGGLGIDTSYSICKPFMIEPVWKNYFTRGSLTSLEHSLTQEIDHKIAFFPELNSSPFEVISMIKSLQEEGEIGISKDMTKGFMSMGRTHKSQPSLVIGCNHIPKTFDMPFLSRFDNLYQLLPSVEIWNEISFNQTQTIGKYSELINSIGKQVAEPLARFNKVFLDLKKEHDRENHPCAIIFDDIRDDFDSFRLKLLNRIKDENLISIFSRDTEIGLRRINTSAWLNHANRKIQETNGTTYFFANDEDLKQGLESYEKSLNNKNRMFAWLMKRNKESRGFKDEAFGFFKANFDRLKGLSSREMSDFMCKNNYKISHMTCKKWFDDCKV